MKNFHILIACSMLLVVGSTFAAGNSETLVYPTKDNPSFLIEVPTSWKLTPAEEDGDYFHLENPKGAVISFRTLEGSETALADSMKHCLTRTNEKFKDVELGDAEDWNPSGLTGFYAVGTAKEKNGNPVRIAFAWCALPDEKIAELWFITDIDDEAGMDQASKIVNSLTAP